MKLWCCSIILAFQMVFVSAMSYGNTVKYGQKLNEADWTVVTSKKRCVLHQDIALYGKVAFEQVYRDKGMKFNLYLNRIPHQTVKARLSAVPPEWNHVTLLRPIGSVTLKAKSKAFSLQNKLSLRIISELEDGMFPTLSYKSTLSSSNDIHVAISPINFRERLPKFLACIAALPNKPIVIKPKPKPKPKPIKIVPIFDNSEPDTVFFAANSATLRTNAKKKLRLLVKRIKKDKKSKHVIVTGYSDDTGNKTQSTSISKQRALNVQSYLEAQGIPAKYLFTRYFGRDHAIKSNRTANGRAKNRRVHIDVIHSNLKVPR